MFIVKIVYLNLCINMLFVSSTCRSRYLMKRGYNRVERIPMSECVAQCARLVARRVS